MAEAHPLMLYNTLTRRKEAFQPLDPDNVRMYVCGPTVYDYAHIGNARPVIVFDVLFRLLRHLATQGVWDGGKGETKVTYVRNITDVDDKINARAAEEYPDLPLNEAIRRVTTKTEKQFHDDVRALGVLPPTVEPRATEHIAEMKVLIEALVANGHAYVAENHVLFNVPSMPDYGRLSNRSLDEMEAGARVEVAPYKKDPMDFVLWKPSKTVGGAVGEKQAEPSWPSPCGIAALGRPGWHIECSAMAERHLGPVFDIHGGGIDLVFPHHENEIAQSRCAHGTPVMARYWLHNGFLQVEGEKMSKSLGNFITIHELLETDKFGGRRWPGEVLRLNMLRTHYRQPIDWTVAALEETETVLRRFCGRIKQFEFARRGLPTKERDMQLKPAPEIIAALADDLNTPLMLSRAHELYGDDAIDQALLLIGVDVRSYARWLRTRDMSMSSDKIESLLAARFEARKRKDFKEADRIRDELAAMGIALKDSKDPATGEIVTTWELNGSAVTEAS
jgi:cysteinyl-tRNA synthetase